MSRAMAFDDFLKAHDAEWERRYGAREVYSVNPGNPFADELLECGFPGCEVQHASEIGRGQHRRLAHGVDGAKYLRREPDAKVKEILAEQQAAKKRKGAA